MAWRNAIASIKLAQEINTRWPNRDKASDGTIGDAAHQSRTSDHNPWVKDRNGVGVVRARDIDEDLDGNRADSGQDIKPVFDHLLKLAKAGDPRLNGGGYIISEGRIYSERQNWASRPYSGMANPHNKHLHVSFSLNASGYDSDKPWGLLTPTQKVKTVKKDDRGGNVAFIADMANILIKAGYAVDANNKPVRTQLSVPTGGSARNNFVYDNKMKTAIMNIQRFGRGMWALGGKKGVAPSVDGVYGPQTEDIFAFWLPLALRSK